MLCSSVVIFCYFLIFQKIIAQKIMDVLEDWD